MKNSWFGYALALLAASALVAASVFLPSALMRRNETSLLGKVAYINHGNVPSRTLASATVAPAASPSPSADSPSPPSPTFSLGIPRDSKSLLEKIHILANGANTITLQEPTANEIDMKTALNSCMEQIQKLMKLDALPPLVNFPEGYDLNATLQSASSPGGGAYFDYWSIVFKSNSARMKETGSISLTMDAVTGQIFSVKMSTSSSAPAFSLTSAARNFAISLNVDGTLKIMPQKTKDTTQAVWVAKDKSLFLNFYLQHFSGSTAFAMVISTDYTVN